MKRLSIAIPVAACAFAAACDVPDYQTEQGQLGLRLTELNGQILARPARTVDAVVGSRFCVELDGWFARDGDEYHIRGDAKDDQWLRDCFELRAAAGSMVVDATCVELSASGPTALELTPQSCELTDGDEAVAFEDDRLPVTAHAIDDLALTYDDPVVRVIWDDSHPGPLAAFGARPVRTPGLSLPVLADGSYTVFPQPVSAADPTRTVAFSGGTPVAVGDPAPASFVAREDGSAVVSLAVDQTVAVSLALAAGTLVGDELVGVDPSTAAAMEVAVGYARCAKCEDGYGAPSYALAIVRDAAGERLFGAQVMWTLEGAGGTLSSDDAMLEDAVGLDEPCGEDDVGEQKSGTLRASYGALEATAMISFVCPDPADADAGWDVEVVDDDQEPFDLDLGCGCSSDPRSPGAAVLLFVALGFSTRRRRA